MTGAEFKARLRMLGRTQVGFATETGKSLRAVHNWASAGPPSEVIHLLDMLTLWELPFGPSNNSDEALVFSRAVERELDRLLALAGPARREEFIHTIFEWATQKTAIDTPHTRERTASRRSI